VELPWQKIWTTGRKVPLVSTYPFERKNFRFSEGRLPERRAMVNVSVVTTPLETLNEAASPVPVAATVEERMASELGSLLSEYSGLVVDGVDSTFVEWGFDSLLLMQIGVELGKKYGVAVSLRDLMENQNTLARLAAHVVETATPESIRHLTTAPAPAPTTPKGNVSDGRPAPAAPVNIPGSQQNHEGGLSIDAAFALRQQLLVIREFIDQQLGQIDLPAPTSPEVPAEALPGPVLMASRIVGVAGGKTEVPSRKPLIRAKHAEPPEPGAFRAFPAKSDDVWYILDTNKRRYRLATH
jgi:acyl carrier protein